MSKNIITVFGATGSQGGSVVDIFTNDPKLKNSWAVRAVTRNVSSTNAQAVAAKGAEVVTADLDDKASLVKAMAGSSAVFAMTNYWDKADAKIELQQGKNLVDAAKETGVNHFIWSSLLDVNKLSNGALPNVHHFDAKAKVEEYARTVGIPASFFLPAFFMSNLSGSMFGPNKEMSGWKLYLPIGGDKPIPLIDTAADTGKFVKGMVLHRDQVLGKRILGAAEYIPVKEIIEVYKRLYPEAGREAAYIQVPHADFKKAVPGPEFIQQEMLENMRLIDEYGYYGGEGLEESHAVVEDKLTSWEEHAKKSFPGLK